MLRVKVRPGTVLAFLICLAGAPMNSQTLTAFSGKVVAVHDGDTISVLDPGKTERKIGIAGVDAPEIGQDFGQAAKTYLSDLIFGKTVTVYGKNTYRNGRLVGQVFLEGQDVGYSLIWAGYAWHYREFENEQTAEDRKKYQDGERFARGTRENIWSVPKPIAPWKFRKQSPGGTKPADSTAIVGNRSSRIYYWPACPDYLKVSEKNRMSFTTRAEAEAAGYRPAQNCGQ